MGLADKQQRQAGRSSSGPTQFAGVQGVPIHAGPAHVGRFLRDRSCNCYLLRVLCTPKLKIRLRCNVVQTRYALRRRFPDAPDAAALADPPGYTAVSLWLLSRHGTRFPTKGRMQQVDSLAQLFPDATNTAQHPWIEGWRSPFEEEGVRVAHGELHDFGECSASAAGRDACQQQGT